MISMKSERKLSNGRENMYENETMSRGVKMAITSM